MGLETFKLEKIKPKEQNIVTKIMFKVAKELRRPIGEYLGKKFSKVKKVTPQKVTKEKLIEKGKGKGLNLEIENKHTLNGFKFLSSKESKKWIVIFNGMGDQYESHLDALNALSEDVGANVLAFNYRGVGMSSGKPASIKDWVEDGQYVLQYLEKNGVKAEDITIYGHSLGGGIASDVYKKQKEKPSLVMESSPSTLAKAIKSKRGTFAGVAAMLFNWDFNSYKVIKNADSASQEHIALVVNRRDPTVRYQEASLYKKLAKEGRGKLQIVKIGEKHEEFGKVSVKKEIKDFEKVKTPHDKKDISEEAKEYRAQYGELRKKGTLKDLPHPHDRVMDRRAVSPANPFEEKFKKEDEKAYNEIVGVFKSFLNIS